MVSDNKQSYMKVVSCQNWTNGMVYRGYSWYAKVWKEVTI